MRFKTITAQFEGTCGRCGTPIVAGERIRWGGPGRTYHLKKDCPATSNAMAKRLGPIDDSPGAFLSYLDPSGAYTADGAFMGRTNPNGRCEDAPCCGCCT